MKLDNIEKPNYSFPNIYRGVVEDNADPLDAGRVKIRIYGMHDINGQVTPIEELPWAEPALGLEWSGGYNLNNRDHQNETPDTPGNRYDPGTTSKLVSTDKPAKDYSQPTTFVEEIEDPYGNACGTGGRFVVPKRGNWVFVFFDGGNHMCPIYFAMAPMKRDWDTQKQWRNKEVDEKIKQLQAFRGKFDPRAKAEPTEKETWAPKAVVNAVVGKPKIEIPEISQKYSNRDISCTTSANGTTIIVDNRLNKERIYVIHKNFLDLTDENGNKKIYVGSPNEASTDPNVACNYEIGVEGNHELHVLGNYNVYVKGNTFIQCDSNVQIDAKKNVGIVSREGDIDILVQKGNINTNVFGNCDINVQKNANIKVNSDANLLVQGNLKATVNGTSDFLLKGEVKIQTSGTLNATVKGKTVITSTGGVDITAPDVKISGNVHVGGKLNVSKDANIGGNAIIQSVCYVLSGIDCGGYIRNKGLADLGSPLIAHSLIVTSGSGTGIGRPAIPPSAPGTAASATEAKRVDGSQIDKEELKSAKTDDEK
jgi:hypothetical protein